MNILVVDDDTGVVSFIKRGLVHEGYSVDSARRAGRPTGIFYSRYRSRYPFQAEFAGWGNYRI